MKNVAVRVAEVLGDLGVRYIFGVPSGNWIDFMEGLRLTGGIDFILVSNEASGAFMADVCWRLTGDLAACFGTFGPGACNLSTGVCSAYLDRSPMLVFTDEMDEARINRVVQMNIDHPALFKPITKGQFRLDKDHVENILTQACGQAVSEVPGPVYIGLPAGIGTEPVKKQAPVTLRADVLPVTAKESLVQMETLLKNSRKPVMVVGNSANRFPVRDLIIQIAEKYHMPVVITPMAKGIVPEDHFLYAGVLSHAMADMVGKIHQQADLVIGVGYDPVEINYEDWMPPVPLIHIDTVPADVDKKKIAPVNHVIGDILNILERLYGMAITDSHWNLDELTQNRQEIFNQMIPSEEDLNALSVLSILREEMASDGILTCDVGAHLHLIGQVWKTPSPECQLMTNGGSSMGFGIPAALAAKLVMPERQVACVTGDGGFLMMAGEMVTADRLKLPVVFVVMTDGDLSLIKVKQERKGYGALGTRLTDRSSLGDGNILGVPSIPVSHLEGFRRALKTAFNTSNPTIIEARIKKSDYDPFILRGNK